MKAVRELKRDLPNLYNSKKIEQKDVIFLFGKVREILENKKKYQTDFPELNLFCNWCFHSKLTSSRTIHSTLVKVSKSLSSAIHVGPDTDPRDMTKAFIQIGSNILNIPKLRKGLLTVLEKEGIPPTIATSKEWWDACLQLLIFEISEKPLEFPENVLNGSSKDNKYFNEIMQLPGPLGQDKIIRLEVKLDEGENSYKLHFFTHSRVTYVVDLFGKEDEGAFPS